MILIDVTNDKVQVSSSDCPEKVGETILLFTNHRYAGENKPTDLPAGVSDEVLAGILGVASEAVCGQLAAVRNEAFFERCVAVARELMPKPAASSLDGLSLADGMRQLAQQAMTLSEMQPDDSDTACDLKNLSHALSGQATKVGEMMLKAAPEEPDADLVLHLRRLSVMAAERAAVWPERNIRNGALTDLADKLASWASRIEEL